MTSEAPGVPVLVIGAGIGGLTTALQLHRVGIACQIVEAVTDFGPVGVGITLLPHAAQQLGLLGLERDLAKGSVLTRESVFYNRFGQLVYREPAGRFAGYNDPQYSIHRAHLHKVLLEAVIDRLGPSAVWSGHRVRAAHAASNALLVEMDRAEGPALTLGAEIAVAADGIHSVVRAQLFPDEGPPRYSGVTMWRGTSRWPAFLSGASMVRAGSLATGQLVCYPVTEADDQGMQLINWVVELETEQRPGRGWTQRGSLADFCKPFEDWHFDWLDVPGMLAAADIILEYPMVDQDPLPRWSHGRLTLLGDAAHPMVPRGSNGAGQTILDAAALADCLAEHRDDPVRALQLYDDRRRPATADVVRASRTSSPDSILRTVYERTGDRPFSRISDVISEQELKDMSDKYRAITGASREALQPS